MNRKAENLREISGDSFPDRKPPSFGKRKVIDEEHRRHSMMIFDLIRIALILLLSIALLVMISLIGDESSEDKKRADDEKVHVSYAVPEGVDDGISREKLKKDETEDAEKKDALPASGGGLDQDYEEIFKEKIFRQNRESSFVSQVHSVSGLSMSDKQRINLMEADFIRDVGAFLSSRRVLCKCIRIKEALPCSSEGAISYLASLLGDDEHELIILFFPDFPGEYIFSLTEKAETNQVSSENNPSGTAASDQTAPHTVPVSQVQQNMQNNQVQVTGQSGNASQGSTLAPNNQMQANPAPASQVGQNIAAASDQSYDATRLSIRKIPETLINYIDNRYELQYELYDYLYHSGKREVSSATIRDYSVDGDSRSAAFTIVLDDGSSITGSYDKDGNSYQFTG